jgi:hypothetical protein
VDEEISDKYPLPRDGDFPSPNLTLSDLVDTRSRDALIETLKWGHFLEEPNAEKLYGKGYWLGGHYRPKGVYRPAATCIMAGDGTFCFVCADAVASAIYRTSSRGPAGGIVPKDVPRMKGRLRRPYYFYSVGLFGRASNDLSKLEKQKKGMLDPDVENASQLRKGMEDSLQEALQRLDGYLKEGDALAASEHLSLLDLSFKGSEVASKVEAKKKEVQGSENFKKELKAGLGLLKLTVLLKDRRTVDGQKTKARKLLSDFIAKNPGTRAVAKAKALMETLNK